MWKEALHETRITPPYDRDEPMATRRAERPTKGARLLILGDTG